MYALSVEIKMWFCFATDSVITILNNINHSTFGRFAYFVTLIITRRACLEVKMCVIYDLVDSFSGSTDE